MVSIHVACNLLLEEDYPSSQKRNLGLSKGHLTSLESTTTLLTMHAMHLMLVMLVILVIWLMVALLLQVRTNLNHKLTKHMHQLSLNLNFLM